MHKSFFEQPILNSPYEVPQKHHALDKDGQPLDQPPISGRRRSELITPVPKPRKQAKGTAKDQKSFVLSDAEGLSTEEQEYNPTPIINEIRQHLQAWRDIPNPADWGVTPATAQLLRHWRHHNFQGVRPFFCQVEAAETAIWLTEVARRERRYKHIWTHLEGANKDANPEIMRLALKMATGSGKTTVMAMLIAWQTVNAVRSPTSTLYTRGFLLIAPGITIRDRLRVLLPQDAESYYRTRELMPADMLPDIDKAKIVIANYHAFKRRETMEVSKVGRALLQGRGEPVVTIESEGQMLQRACGELLAMKNIVVINDEAHHCYREKPETNEEAELKGEDNLGGAASPVYVVQTNTELVKRCILMTTDPGDLVFDPTCGSGTTAYVAEQWGRRWITADTSRVALALARARLMSATFPYYLLKDSPEGHEKSQSLAGKPLAPSPTHHDIRQGFVYERATWSTSGSIANNSAIEQFHEAYRSRLEELTSHLNKALGVSWNGWEVPRIANSKWTAEARKIHADWLTLRQDLQRKIDDSIATVAEIEMLYDRPYEDKGRARVAGPFTVESLSPHRVVPADEDMLADEAKATKRKPRQSRLVAPPTDFAEMVLEHLRTAGVHQAEKRDTIRFTSLARS